MLNQVQIIGRVGNDPDIKELDNGVNIAKFSVATTEKWKDKSGETKEHTEWHKVVIFGRLSEVVKNYVSKGSLLYLSGKLKTNKYTDENGAEKYSTNVVADTMKLLGGNSKDSNSNKSKQQKSANQQSDDYFDDDIPF